MAYPSKVGQDSSNVRREFAVRFDGALSQPASSPPPKKQSPADSPRHSKKAKAADEAYTELSRYVLSLKKAAPLDACLQEYLLRYPKYPIADPRSRLIFITILAERIKIAPQRDPDLQKLANDLLVPPQQKPPAVRVRFYQLSPDEQREIMQPLLAKLAKPKPTSILDFLRDEYERQHTVPPSKDADLYTLDPAPSPALKSELEKYIANVQQAWDVCVLGNEEWPRFNLRHNLGAYRAYLGWVMRTGPMPLFQVIKYLQDRVWTRRREIDAGHLVIAGDHSPLTAELYAMACLQLLIYAQGKLALEPNRQRFTDAERDYFLAPLRMPANDSTPDVKKSASYEYITDLENRFSTPLGSVAEKFDLTYRFLDVILLTKNQIAGTNLVPHEETMRIQELWAPHVAMAKALADSDPAAAIQMMQDPATKTKLQGLMQLMKIEVPVGDTDLARGIARVGASPGINATAGRCTIIHIDPNNHDRFYVEFEHLKPLLFSCRTIYISRKLEASRVYEVYLATAGILDLITIQFLIMGFLAPFIEAGFAGLIFEIALFYATSKLTSWLEKEGIDPFWAEFIGFVVQLGTPHPNFKPKVVVPREIPVLEIKAGLPGGTAPQMNADWLNRSISDRSPKPQEIVTTKAGPLLEAPAPQMTPAWLDRSLGEGVGGRSVPSSPEPATQFPAKPAPSPEPPRTIPRQQGIQYPTYRPPHAENAPAPAEPPAPRQQQQMQQQQQTRIPQRPSEPKPPTSEAPAPRKRWRPKTASEKAADAAVLRATEARYNKMRQVQNRGMRSDPTLERVANNDQFEVWGDPQAFRESKRGYHWYEYYSDGKLSPYTGISGGVGGKRLTPKAVGAAEGKTNNWVDRIRQEHGKTAWWRSVDEVRVYEGTEAEVMAAEEVGIESNPKGWNVRTGEYTEAYGALGQNREVLMQRARARGYFSFKIRHK